MCSLLVHLRLHINFSSQNFVSLYTFHLKAMLGYSGQISVFAILLLYIQQLAYSLLQRQPVTAHLVVSFWARPALCLRTCTTLPVVCIIQTNVLNVYHSAAHLFFHFLFLFQHSVSFRECQLQHSPTLCSFLFLMWVSLQILSPLLSLFIFRDLGFLIL